MNDTFFRQARVQVWSSSSTTAVAQNDFGPACVAASLDGVTNDHWLISLVFDVRLSADAAVLLQHGSDDRLLSSWIEAQCGIGRCRVVAQRASASPEALISAEASSLRSRLR